MLEQSGLPLPPPSHSPCSFHSSFSFHHLNTSPLLLSQWTHQHAFLSCRPPIKPRVPPASKVNYFISKTRAGCDPRCRIFLLRFCLRFVVLQHLQIVLLCLVVCPVFSWNLNPPWFHFPPLVRSDPWFGQGICVCVCVRETVWAGEEKGHANMPGARAHFACKMSKHFLFHRWTFCHLRLFYLLDSFTAGCH